MRANKPLLFQSDPKKFMELLMLDDTEKRFDALKANFDDVVLCEILRYGIFNDAKMIEPLAQLYEKTVVPNYADEKRWELYLHIKGMLEHVDFVSVNALLPFIAEEPSRRIVSTAVIDYVSLGPLINNDPMSRPKDIIGMIKSGQMKNRGAAFGGLLHLGDSRVCELLWLIKELLTDSDVNDAVKCSTVILYSATVEFEIGWLEQMKGDVREGLFGNVASGLVLQKRSNKFNGVITGQREFPVSKNPTPAEQKRSRELAKPISIEEYMEHIAPRLFALERTEPPPRVMPHVLAAWNLKPATDPSGTARIDDRLPPINAPKPNTPVVIPNDQIVEIAEEWFDGEGRIFLCWGILNPNGPTLYCLGDRELNGKRRIFFRWLHMFGGSTYYVKAIDREQPTYDDILDSALAITKYLSERRLPTPFDVIPSFVIANDADEAMKSIAKRLIKSDAASNKDWGREIAYLDTFGDDFFGRAGCELRAVYETAKSKSLKEGENRDFLKLIEAQYGHIPAFRNAAFPDFRSATLTNDVLEGWWGVVDTVKHSRSAMQHLAEMWPGAISQLSGEMAKNAIPFERVVDFLVAYGFNLPK
jgi:hypothetical protein